MRVNIAKPSRRNRREAGVTLIEALVSMAVFGVSFTALYGGISMGFAVIGTARENLRATQVMVEKVETLRLYTFAQINTPGFIPTTFTDSLYPETSDGDGNTEESHGLVYHGKVIISDGPGNRSYNPYLKRVTITVNWRTGNRTYNRSMSTLVTRHGLQKYVY
jgi:type II secretory pathway pseudopilin PulG